MTEINDIEFSFFLFGDDLLTGILDSVINLMRKHVLIQKLSSVRDSFRFFIDQTLLLF